MAVVRLGIANCHYVRQKALPYISQELLRGLQDHLPKEAETLVWLNEQPSSIEVDANGLSP